MAATKTSALKPNGDTVSSRARLLYLVTLALIVSVPYFWLERHVFFSLNHVPASALDRWVPFLPGAAWVYLSLYLQLSLPLFLCGRGALLRQMVFGFVWTCVVSNVVFFFWPTTIAVSTASPSNLAMRLILFADSSGNALPSLHASLAIYCALCSNRLLKGRGLRTALWVWTLLIMISTLLVKRHMV